MMTSSGMRPRHFCLCSSRLPNQSCLIPWLLLTLACLLVVRQRKLANRHSGSPILDSKRGLTKVLVSELDL